MGAGRSISLYWYRNEPNFGDAFSPLAVEHCFGCGVRRGGKWDADLVAEGSVLDFTLLRDAPGGWPGSSLRRLRIAANRRLRKPLLVWGSGLLFPPEAVRPRLPIRRPRFLALRGELTRREMTACGLLAEGADVALGDPGLFMPEVLGVSRRAVFRRGLVLHACSWADGTAAAFGREHPEVRLIDPRRPPAEVVRDIADCSEVFSSSLHGLVAADALGIPNRWVALKTPYACDGRNRFKFEDYYSAFGVRRTPCEIADVPRERPDDPVAASEVERIRRGLRSAAAEAGGRHA